MFLSSAFIALGLSATANAYWLMGAGAITKERIDPLVNPGEVSGHTHIVFGGSNFGLEVTTNMLQQSVCTSVPIAEDKSNYWAPLLYFQWANGSFSSVDGGAVIYYLFPDTPGRTTAFPKDFRMLSGNPTKRTYDANDPAARAVDFLCLDFNGQTTKHNGLPEKHCPSGIRSQVNFPSCWDGKNVDSPDHRSHVAYRSGGPDSGECTDPRWPVNIPRVFMEIYWNTGEFDRVRSQAKNPNQPFVFAYGDETGYGNHADLYNGWDDGVLQRAVDGCNCDRNGDPTCCAQNGKKLFTLNKDPKCRITQRINERTTGMLPKLPGRNPIQPAGKTATMYRDTVIPALISPVYAYTGDFPTATGTVVGAPQTIGNPTPTGTGSSTSTSTATSSGATTTSTATTSSQGQTSTGATTSSGASSTTATATSSGATTTATTTSSAAGTTSTASTTSTTSSSAGTSTATSSTSTGTTVSSSSYPGGGSSTGKPTITLTSSGATVVKPTPTSTPSTTTGTSTKPPHSHHHHPTTTRNASQPAHTTAPGGTALPVTTTAPAKPVMTRICRKKPKKNPFQRPHAHGHGHGRGHFNRNLRKRYDFDVDDYYYKM